MSVRLVLENHAGESDCTFWDVDSGSVRIGGIDVKDYKLDSLMKNISMVFQNVYLFPDTIENNIKFGSPNATHEDVVKAAKAARCHDFISALPEGYQTVIGESGATISGGEKQRISIARAIMKDAPIIILDEATANVDPENEAELQKAIEALTQGKTIIMIAHRLKTVKMRIKSSLSTVVKSLSKVRMMSLSSKQVFMRILLA